MGSLSTRVDNALKYMQFKDTDQAERNKLTPFSTHVKMKCDLKRSNSMTSLESFVAQIL